MRKNKVKISKLISKIDNVYEYNWDYIWSIPEFNILKSCQQSTVWHQEGNVDVHTKLACEHALTFANDPSFPSEDAELLLLAALFHDIGKGVTTKQGKDGRWHSYNHELMSERITRRLLWDEGHEIREKICSLVRWHMAPMSIFERKDYIGGIVTLSEKVPSLRLLLILKRCDLEGSIMDLKEKNIDRIKLSDIEKIAEDLNCLNEQPNITHRLYRHQAFAEFANKKEVNVYMIIGLPGSGKDTFINNVLISDERCVKYIDDEPIRLVNPKNACVLCRDDIRAELGLCKPGEKIVSSSQNEELVSQLFNKRMLDAAKHGKDIIINNINLKSEYRKEYIRQLSNYALNVIYIYIETDSLDINLERRDGQVDLSVYNSMIEKFDWPDKSEYDSIHYIKGN